MKKKLIKKVSSINELYNFAREDSRYLKLAQLSSQNLGGQPNQDLDECIRWLNINASESNSEAGVVDEINFCRDLVD